MFMIIRLLEFVRSLFVNSTPVRDWDALLSHEDGALCRDRDNGSGLSPMITRLEEERTAALDFVERTVQEAETAGRDLSETEKDSLKNMRARVKELDEQLAPMREFAELRTAHRSSGATGTGRPADTGQGAEGRSLGAASTQPRAYEYRTAGEVLADAARATAPDHGANSVPEHMRSVSRDRLEAAGLTIQDGSLARIATQTTADTPGILPENIVGQIVSDIDAARPFISSVGSRNMGGIPGKTFHRPVITQHTQVGEQTGGEKTELASRKMVIGDVDFTKRTFGGAVNVSRQDIDWTSPAAWDALIGDLQEQYALETENAAADAFVTSVTQTQELTSAVGVDPTLSELVAGLYGAAVKAYQGSGRLPNMIWASLDWWPKFGTLIDVLKASTAGNGGGASGMDRFAGNLLGVERVIVPSFATGTLVVGVKERVEVYEDRIGLLSVVEPKILGVEVAYGGYLASGTVKPLAFAKVINAA